MPFVWYQLPYFIQMFLQSITGKEKLICLRILREIAGCIYEQLIFLSIVIVYSTFMKIKLLGKIPIFLSSIFTGRNLGKGVTFRRFCLQLSTVPHYASANCLRFFDRKITQACCLFSARVTEFNTKLTKQSNGNCSSVMLWQRLFLREKKTNLHFFSSQIST